MSNIVKHAAASNAKVTLDLSGFEPVLFITVNDDGKGFDSNRRWIDGIGLIAMRERVAAAGGTVNISSSTAKGTNVDIRLPSAASGSSAATG